MDKYDETPFVNYVKSQTLKRTFNGLNIEEFSWYKKVLGSMKEKKHGKESDKRTKRN